MNNKQTQQLRKQLLQKRKQLSTLENSLKSKKIIDALLKLPQFQKANTISIYYSNYDEVNTIELIKLCLIKNKKVVVPKLLNLQQMIMVEINQTNINNFLNLGLNKFNNWISKVKLKVLAKHQIDLMIIPGLGFDQNLNRLGRGLGNYDRYLANYQGIKIMLSFEIQKVTKFKIEKHDQKMNLIITERKIY